MTNAGSKQANIMAPNAYPSYAFDVKRNLWEENLGLHRPVIVIKSVYSRREFNIHRLSFLGKDETVLYFALIAQLVSSDRLITGRSVVQIYVGAPIILLL